MSQALPADLINPSIPELIRASDDNVSFTSSEALHRFWKVYEAQHDYVDDFSIPRMRNLFWRIWSSDTLAEHISNERLNQLWSRCRRREAFVPFQLPRSYLRRYGQPQENRLLCSPGNLSKPSEKVADYRSELARGGTVVGGGYETPSSGSTESSGRPGLRRNTSGSKGRVPVVASGSRGRARPSVPRRKSSQKETQQALPSRPSQATVRSPNLKPPSHETPGQGARPSEIPGRKEPAFALPSASSWQSMEDSSPGQPSPILERQGGATGSLVERDFRSKFLSSATNLPALGRMRKTGSVVRFADEEEEIGKGKGKEVAFAESHMEFQGRGRSSSQAIDSDESGESDEVQLPRTQSQLSMAIQDRRKKSGSRDLGPAPAPAPTSENQKKNESKGREEELLKMAREAAKPTIPKALPGSGREERYRSPSPGPTF